MADRRMFSKRISDSDAFIEMPSSTQALYFHLNQSADDDGFNNQVQLAIMKAHASTDDLKMLIAKNFVITFGNGVVVIKHWRLHNTLRKDRYNPTAYQEELATLHVKENGVYTLGTGTNEAWLPDGCQTVAPGKYSIDKSSIVYPPIVPPDSENKRKFTPPSIDEVTEYCKQRNNGIDPQRFIDFYVSNGWKVGRNPMKDWKAAVRTWEQRRRDEQPKEAPTQTRKVWRNGGYV